MTDEQMIRQALLDLMDEQSVDKCEVWMGKSEEGFHGWHFRQFNTSTFIGRTTTEALAWIEKAVASRRVSDQIDGVIE